MDVAELVWWWQTGWTAWAKEHGIHTEPEGPEETGPDRAALRARYGAGGRISR